MAKEPFADVLLHIRRLIGPAESADQTDGQLLLRFAAGEEDAAFAALVQRHGPLVLGVCRRLLPSAADAEDAFQATFLVLLRKAKSLNQYGSLANWLYTVAYHLALKIRARNARREARERPIVDEPPSLADADAGWDELRPVLDAELNRLPAKYRQAVLLCYLEGKTTEEAGRELGCPAGTIKCRLSRAREMLRKRLTRRGLSLAGAALAATLAEQATAAVPSALFKTTTQAAATLAAGNVPTAAVVSANLASLIEGALRAMRMQKLTSILLAVLTLGVCGLGIGWLAWAGGAGEPAQPREGKTHVLFVGGDWKSQLPNYKGKTPLRGYFVRQEVEKAAPGQFDFTLWTNYEFQQYADAESLRRFDVVVVGDIMGQGIMPRTVRGLTDFVEGGGGFLYCDNHKAFSFNTRERSFDPVLPIEVVPFRIYGPDPNQPMVGKPFQVQVAAPDHPVMKGLDFAAAPPLRGARYGKIKEKAQVLATTPDGKEIWVAWQKGKGRAMWAGGVFANDELSEDFAKWPRFGKFYAQTLTWLSEKSTYDHKPLQEAVAAGNATVDLTKKGPTVTAAHFGIGGVEDAPGGSYPMKNADLALFQQLKLRRFFSRTEVISPAKILKNKGKKGPFDFPDLGTDLTNLDSTPFDFKNTDIVLQDIERLDAIPLCLAWCPWYKPYPDPKRYTTYFAAALEHANGKPGTAHYKPRVPYFEIMNEPHLGPAPEVLNRYADFYNYASSRLKKRYPGVQFGCGGFFEWTYIQAIIDRCGKNLDWLSRHPYGLTGEAVFDLHDQYLAHARAKGLNDLKIIITEWDFWVYGEPAFDYIMMRWKPLLDRADTCPGTLQYRWREYEEGGYVFGVHGENFGKKYGELPPEWPNPGKDKPITYRYNGFWLMRDCRGPQYAAALDLPELKSAEGPRAYAVASSDGKQFNVVLYYGYPYKNLKAGKVYQKLKVRLRTPIPAEIKGRNLVVARADCKNITVEPERPIVGDTLDLEVEIPALSGVSITVR